MFHVSTFWISVYILFVKLFYLFLEVLLGLVMLAVSFVFFCLVRVRAHDTSF